MAARGPTFRWNALAFLALTAVVLALTVAFLVLLDPRTQGWWGDRFSGLGTLVHDLLRPLLER